MCRNCYSKLQNLDQRCRLFYEECQRNARIVMRANTKRMMRSSPLSGPQKRTNFSKTPTKTRKTQRKTQLFKESATPESTTPEEIGLKVDFVTGRMCFQVLSDPRFSFLNSFRMILEECTPRKPEPPPPLPKKSQVIVIAIRIPPWMGLPWKCWTPSGSLGKYSFLCNKTIVPPPPCKISWGLKNVSVWTPPPLSKIPGSAHDIIHALKSYYGGRAQAFLFRHAP